MKNVRKVVFIVRAPGNVWEGIRSALGLTVENLTALVCLLCDAPDLGPLSEDQRERLEMMDDMEGEIWALDSGWCGLAPFVRCVSLEEMTGRLADFDLVIGF